MREKDLLELIKRCDNNEILDVLMKIISMKPGAMWIQNHIKNSLVNRSLDINNIDGVEQLSQLSTIHPQQIQVPSFQCLDNKQQYEMQRMYFNASK